jgi:hypothetical protein
MNRLLKLAASSISILCLGVSGLLAAPRPAWAASTLAVTTQLDEYDLEGTGAGCSLREAVAAINQGASFGGCPASSATQEIFLPGGDYTLALYNTTGEMDASGDLNIHQSMRISGEGPAATRILARSDLLDRVIHIAPLPGGADITVTLEGLTIQDGITSQVYGGGGLLNEKSSTTLENVVITANKAGTDATYATGGGLNNMPGASLTLSNSTVSQNTGTYGGGIFNSGTLIVSNCTISANTARISGGGLENRGTGVVIGSTISSNTVSDPAGSGAGIAGSGSLEVTNSLINANTGSGISLTGQLALLNSQVEDNSAAGVQILGGIASLVSSSISGNSAADPEKGAVIVSDTTLTLKNCAIQNNSSTGLVLIGDTAALTNTNLTNNSGAGLQASDGMLTLLNGSLSSNGGMGLLVTGGSATLTSATLMENSGDGLQASGAALVVQNSTIARNHGGAGLRAAGGNAVVTNSTIAGNTAPDPTQGMGIASAGGLTLLSSTIADNSGVGLQVSPGAAVEIQNSIIARHAGANCTLGGDLNVNLTFTTHGRNLLDDLGPSGPEQCPFITGGPEPDLEAPAGLSGLLEDNGGPTWTYALEPGSPAIDQVPAGSAGCLLADQRGYGRPVDGGSGENGCDIGAFELGGLHYETYISFAMQ